MLLKAYYFQVVGIMLYMDYFIYSLQHLYEVGTINCILFLVGKNKTLNK